MFDSVRARFVNGRTTAGIVEDTKDGEQANHENGMIVHEAWQFDYPDLF